MKFNEEMIKNNVILPMLTDIGFCEDELEFERNFFIQLGRGVYNVRNDDVAKGNGRLDILCKLGGENLFIIELKAEGIELEDKDRKQGLSYARLLEPMAPYVLVTNGSKSNLYDTISGEVVEKMDADILANGYTANLDEEICLRFEAVKHFLGYSFENLLNFCMVNNEDMLRKFCSRSNETVSEQIMYKYIPSLYVNRYEIEDMFSGFLNDKDKCVFSIIGDSGVGKTNLMCNLVQNYKSEACLFYSGSILGNSFLNELVNDFNLIFSSEESEIGVLKKISKLTQRHNKQLVIFIDAIDEWVADDKVLQLNRLVKCIKKLNIKLCISCKSSIWNLFIVHNGIRTELNDSLYRNLPKLTNFNDIESKEAIIKYSRFLKIDQMVEEIPYNINNPFNLRIAFEVSYSDKVPLNLHINSQKIFARYILLKLENTLNSNLLYRFLDGISSCLLKLDKIQIYEEELRIYLNMNISDEIPKELFTLNFLYKYFDENYRTSIGFYFSGIRDYIVAIRVSALGGLQSELRFKKIIELLSNFIGENAVHYFFKTSNTKEKEDCINAYIEYDYTNNKSKLVDLISLNGSYLSKEINKELCLKITKYLKVKFEENNDSRIIIEQIVVSMGELSKLIDVELDLIDLFTLILTKYKNLSLVSHIIAKLLMNYDSKEGSYRLITLLLNLENSGYVRRYIVESISKRTTFSKKDLFLKLIIDESLDVRTWVKGWYIELEDISLRDRLLEILDTKNDNSIAEYIFKTLSYSKIKDTGEKLFTRLKTKNYNHEATGWLCRSIANLGFKEAIPTFIQLFIDSKSERFSELLLTSISFLKASEAAPVVLDAIYNYHGTEGYFLTTLCTVFAEIALDKQLEQMVEKSINNDDETLEYIIILILSDVQSNSYNEKIFEFIMNKQLEIKKRISVLQNWVQRKLYHNENGYLTSKSDMELAITSEKLKNREISYLYQLVEENSEISIISLVALLSMDQDTDKLYNKVTEYLPQMMQHFHRRQHNLINSLSFKRFGERIRPWLNKQFYLENSNKVFIENCLEFCVILGDNTTLEAIYDNKMKLIKYIGERNIDEIVYAVRNENRI